MKSRLFAIVAALGFLWTTLAVSVHADVYEAAATMIRYDVDSSTVTYCTMQGPTGDVFGATFSGPARVDTVGSNTTVTSDTALSGALTPVVARDVMWVRSVSQGSTRLDGFANGTMAVITAKTDNNQVTVDPAVDWSAGLQYSYLKTVCGTTAGDGWVDVSSSSKISLGVHYEQGDLDNLSFRFECKQAVPGAPITIVYPSEGDGCGNAGTQASGFCDIATASATANFTWEEYGSWSWCRIGFKFKTTDTSDAGANLERVSGSISVTRLQ